MSGLDYLITWHVAVLEGTIYPVSWENGDPLKWGPRVPILLGKWGPRVPIFPGNWGPPWKNGDPQYISVGKHYPNSIQFIAGRTSL